MLKSLMTELCTISWALAGARWVWQRYDTLPGTRFDMNDRFLLHEVLVVELVLSVCQILWLFPREISTTGDSRWTRQCHSILFSIREREQHLLLQLGPETNEIIIKDITQRANGGNGAKFARETTGFVLYTSFNHLLDCHDYIYLPIDPSSLLKEC